MSHWPKIPNRYDLGSKIVFIDARKKKFCVSFLSVIFFTYVHIYTFVQLYMHFLSLRKESLVTSGILEVLNSQKITFILNELNKNYWMDINSAFVTVISHVSSSKSFFGLLLSKIVIGLEFYNKKVKVSCHLYGHIYPKIGLDYTSFK